MGLVGIRERAESTGGRWAIGPVAGGGFRVAVSWPGRHVIRVVLADDQRLVRAGFRVLLDGEDGIEVVGEADDGAGGRRRRA